MARVTKPEEYSEKRNEILDSAQRLIYAVGYEGMSIQDILKDLGISKGAFYHYFDSKPALLTALVERIGLEGVKVWSPIASDPDLGTLEKLVLLFENSIRWKVDNKDILFRLLRVWYDDSNAIVRQKVYETAQLAYVPMLTKIIREGVAEGILSTPYPEEAGLVVWNLLLGLGEPMAHIILSGQPETVELAPVERLLAAYTDAMERILGAPRGTLKIMDIDTIQEWLAVALQYAQA